MGPGFFTDHLNSGDLFNIVHGNADHYILDLGINAYWLRYLEQVNQVDRALQLRVLSGMDQSKDRLINWDWQ